MNKFDDETCIICYSDETLTVRTCIKCRAMCCIDCWNLYCKKIKYTKSKIIECPQCRTSTPISLTKIKNFIYTIVID